MITCDESKSKFEEFKNDYESLKSMDISESDTRSKLIDRMLISVLGWDEKDIIREGHVDKGYFDYKVSIAGLTFIIEAKRQFSEFTLPNDTRRKCKLDTVYQENREVFNQIRDYLSDCGCDVGIITNGKQYIIAKFINTNGISWKKNKCIVYRSLQEIEENFVEFWNTLSKESIIHNKGIKQLYDVEESFYKTILSSISEKDNEIVRNDLSAKIAPLIDKALGDIYSANEDEDDLEFIKECYVENKEVIKNKRELHGLFCDNPPELKEVSKARNIDSIGKQIDDEIGKYPSEKATSPAPKPIIIIGSRGAGKTTFLKFLLNNNTLETNSLNTPYLFVNMMKYYAGNDVIDFNVIYDDLLQQFDEKYPSYNINSLKVLKRIYAKEINSNKIGIWKYYYENEEIEYNKKMSDFLYQKTANKQEHFKALNLYLTKEIHKRILIVFDNADQLSDQIQEQVYLNACALNKQAKFGVIISLREGYYYNWRNRPPFNAFDSNAFHVAAPNYGEVLQKRLNYIIEKVKFNKNNTLEGSIGDKSFELSESKIEEFFVGVNSSLFGTDNAPILDFITQMSFPNVREGLRLFKTFLVSGYTDVSEYILRVVYNRDEHTITIPIHEFVKTIGLENKYYYNHTSSQIKNLFYPTSPNSDGFIKYYILKALDERLSFEGNINKFKNYNELVDEFNNYGYKKDIINQEVEELIKENFVETDKKLTDISWTKLPNEDFSVTITSRGHYYINELVNRFYYFELVVQDTPIADRQLFEEIKKEFPIPETNGKKDMRTRLRIVNQFVEYLKLCEGKEKTSNLQQKYGRMVNNILINGLQKDLERISNRYGCD